ncbi:hypothetical protein VM98_37875, partial [Streptomyces rubellomurinus subsp. indigoferus]
MVAPRGGPGRVPGPAARARGEAGRPAPAARGGGRGGWPPGGGREPYQLVLPPGAAAVGIRVGACGPAGPAEARAALGREEFDLATEPPLRVAVFPLGEDEHVLG